MLAATEHLHRRIARMNDRIRLLEDALGSLQAKHSEDPHPLLRDELLSVNAHDDDEDVFEEDPSTSNVHQAIDAFGTLSISEHGITQFFGPTGGSEVSLFRPTLYHHPKICPIFRAVQFVYMHILSRSGPHGWHTVSYADDLFPEPVAWQGHFKLSSIAFSLVLCPGIQIAASLSTLRVLVFLSFFPFHPSGSNRRRLHRYSRTSPTA